jgi:hypothetical protein
MKKVAAFAAGCAVGFGLALALLAAALLPLRAGAAGAGGGAPTATENGDINGDGRIDISDAVSLLGFLFQGGPRPAAIDCSPPPPPPDSAFFRFHNEASCGGQATDAVLTLCGTSTTDEAGGGPAACLLAEQDPECEVRVVSDACGGIALCDSFAVEAGHVYEFFLRSDGASPRLEWLDQLVLEEGVCPPAPPGDAPPNGQLTTQCEDIPPPARSWIRLTSDLSCEGAEIEARLLVCTYSVSAVTLAGAGECLAVPAGGSCPVAVTTSAACDDIARCGQVTLEPDRVYDFVLRADRSVAWYEQTLDGEGLCPSPPAPNDVPKGELGSDCNGRG